MTNEGKQKLRFFPTKREFLCYPKWYNFFNKKKYHNFSHRIGTPFFVHHSCNRPGLVKDENFFGAYLQLTSKMIYKYIQIRICAQLSFSQTVSIYTSFFYNLAIVFSDENEDRHSISTIIAIRTLITFYSRTSIISNLKGEIEVPRLSNFSSSSYGG